MRECVLRLLIHNKKDDGGDLVQGIMLVWSG